MLKNLPAIISAFGAFILTVSITYDYGFFYVLGTSFAEMPTTLADHLRSSLNFIPYTIILTFGAFTFEMLNRRIEQGMTEEELIERSPAPKFMERFRNSPKYGMVIIAALVPFTSLFNIDVQMEAWLFSIIVLWVVLHRFLFGHTRIKERTSVQFRLSSMLIPPVLVWFTYQGITDAKEIREGNGTQYVFELEETRLVGILARSFDKYHLIWNQHEKEIMLVSTEKVTRFFPKPSINKSTKNTANAKTSNQFKR